LAKLLIEEAEAARTEVGLPIEIEPGPTGVSGPGIKGKESW
jgi:hypothetical protein